ncbi:hypothetical protein SO802_024251 [Lithocarpus litseifolius]|uniref:RNase H type-1 domain-containing protein n=1 Tax=Lithocarpus litseifolius TaxID=425828 RepID=A0AAW2CAN8_9ROSI
MSTFSIPIKVCDRLDSLTRRFWWKPSQREGRFITWNALDKLCYPRSRGGLGFKKANEMNNALMAKLAWMIASKRDSTYMRILRLKYKVSEDWLRAKAPKNASPIWRAIEKAKSIVSKGACYLIGDGKSVDIWLDSWVPWIQGFTLAPKSASTLRVATKGFKADEAQLTMTADIINLILNPPEPLWQAHDKGSGLKLYPNGLFQAEAEALLWTVQLASRERWCSVTFEGDCKVNKSCNNAAHVVAKFAIESNMSCFFISGNLPPSIVDACKKDAPLCFSLS